MDHFVIPQPLTQSRVATSRTNPQSVEGLGGAPPTPTTIHKPQLSVVVVNYHQWKYTGELVRRLCSSSAVRDGEAEVVVIDNNASSWRDAQRLRRLPGVSLLRWRRNRGFARAVNEATRLSQGEWVLLLNPDMTLAPDFLDEVLARCKDFVTQPLLGIVGFKLHDHDGGSQRSSGPFPTFAGTFLRRLLPRSVRKYHVLQRPDRQEVDWVSGCCLLIKRACWKELGGFDPSFFLYYEDVDLCRRARQAGWQVVCHPGPLAVHHQPFHRREIPAHLRVVTRHALLTYAGKHWSRWQFRLLGRFVQVESSLRRFWARMRGDSEQASAFECLGRIVGSMLADQPCQAARQLLRYVWRQEEHRAGALRGHSQS